MIKLTKNPDIFTYDLIKFTINFIHTTSHLFYTMKDNLLFMFFLGQFSMFSS